MALWAVPEPVLEVSDYCGYFETYFASAPDSDRLDAYFCYSALPEPCCCLLGPAAQNFEDY